MRKFSAVFFALCFQAQVASAQWQVDSTRTESSVPPGVEHRHLVMRNSANGENATLELALFSAKTATLRVLDDPTSSSSLAEMMQRNGCVAGVNGGYFDPDYAPVGLLVSDGSVIAPSRKARLLSGVVSVVGGRVQIQRSAQFSTKTKASAARQCGPFLVEGSKAIASLNNTKSARRTFVATSAGERAMIGFSSNVTLAELAAILASPDLLSESRIQRALNMDGGSSSGFWFSGESGAFSIRERKTVRDYLGVVPKRPGP